VADTRKNQSTVTRIKATGTPTAKKIATITKSPKSDTAAKPKSNRSISAIFKPFFVIGGYFKGSWQELREVRWPTRKATWGLTGAVIGFTTFFIVLILLLDAGFKYVFELILG